MKQLGTDSYEVSHGVSADGLGNAYLAGSTEGSLDGPNAGHTDAFLAKYDSAGDFQWTRQLGTAGVEVASSVSADGQGSIYISGETASELGANADAFVTRYSEALSLQGDYDGNSIVDGNDFLVWQRALGSAELSADGNGDGVVDGEDLIIWRDDFGAGGSSLASSLAIPEPTSLLLVCAAMLLVISSLRPAPIVR
jgi:hypothetical protein